MRRLIFLALPLCAFLLPLPARAEFKFKHHFIDDNLPGKEYGQTSLVDVDKDGDLDFITGGKDDKKRVYWFEYRGPDDWVRHVVGENHPSDVGGYSMDVDGDGWVDHVSGGVWYRNTGKPREGQFERFVFDEKLAAVHDLVVADLAGEGRPGVVTMSDRNNLRWYRIPNDPRSLWERHDIGPGVHAGVAVGDIDGDGDLDVVRSNAWFENTDGKGLKWAEHPIPFGNPNNPYPLATRCPVVDIDKDGKSDLVMTDNEIAGGKIAWLRNDDGKGLKWTSTHSSPPTRPSAGRITRWRWPILTGMGTTTSSRSRWSTSPATASRAGSSGKTWTAGAPTSSSA